jgi:hypothetical protein
MYLLLDLLHKKDCYCCKFSRFLTLTFIVVSLSTALKIQRVDTIPCIGVLFFSTFSFLGVTWNLYRSIFLTWILLVDYFMVKEKIPLGWETSFSFPLRNYLFNLFFLMWNYLFNDCSLLWMSVTTNKTTPKEKYISYVQCFRHSSYCVRYMEVVIIIIKKMIFFYFF